MTSVGEIENASPEEDVHAANRAVRDKILLPNIVMVRFTSIVFLCSVQEKGRRQKLRCVRKLFIGIHGYEQPSYVSLQVWLCDVIQFL
jgi:hypothetical protein